MATVYVLVAAFGVGVTATPASGAYVDEDPERDQKAIAMGRRARPEEQAGAILFLCGTDGSNAYKAQHEQQARPAVRLDSYKIGPLNK